MLFWKLLALFFDCRPSAPENVLPNASLCSWRAACGSLLWHPGLYIRHLGLCASAKFPHSSVWAPSTKQGTALEGITSHNQDHTVVSGWNRHPSSSWHLQSGRWEVLQPGTLRPCQQLRIVANWRWIWDVFFFLSSEHSHILKCSFFLNVLM